MSIKHFLGAMGVTALLLGAASAQTVSQAEITFWQSIKDSTNAEEFQAYLDTYPEGAFAELAQLRIDKLGAGGGEAKPTTNKKTGQPKAEPEPEQTAGSDVVSDAVISLSPQTIRVGETTKLTIEDMPEPSSSDQIIVVAAGAPDSVGVQSSDNVLNWNYASMLSYGPLEIGPFAPGSYEVRYLTTLYNNERRLEVGARAPLEVTR